MNLIILAEEPAKINYISEEMRTVPVSLGDLNGNLGKLPLNLLRKPENHRVFRIEMPRVNQIQP